MIDPERLLTMALAVRVAGADIRTAARRLLGAGVRIGAAQLEQERRRAEQ
jgi:hypothetical protein